MSGMSLRARIYILSVITAGLLLFAFNLTSVTIAESGMLLSLSIIATLALLFKVEGATDRSHYSVNFLVYSFTFVVLGPAETALVILISNVAEWIWHRYQWYIQSFNIGNYLICLNAAGWVYFQLNPRHELGTMLGVVSILVSLAVFTLINHLLVGLVLWLARGESFRKSGIFQFFPLSLDYILFCMGAGAALLWAFHPLAVIFILLPQYLIYITLKVPALERKSETDAKTGLFNARYFDQALNTELKRAHRFDRPLTIVMADLDLLRNINNTYGHLAGDEVLKGVADILRSSVREYDLVARFGGEEFSILMPETRPEEAFPRIEAIRSKIEKTGFPVNTSLVPIRVTMSFGISGRKGHDERGNELIHHADAALYHAKLRGRNGTLIYDEDGITDDLFHKEQAKPASPPGDPLQATPGVPPVSRPEIEIQVNEKFSSAGENAVEENPDLPAARAEKKKGLNHPVNVYSGVVFLAGAALTSYFLRMGLSADWLGLALFTAIVFLIEWFSIEIYRDDTAVSTSAAPMVAGFLLFGPTGALVLSTAFALTALVKNRGPLSRFLFNAGNQLIAAMIIIGLLRSLGSNFLLEPLWLQVLISLGAMVIVYLSTTLLVSMGSSLELRLPLREIWKEKFGWLLPYYIAMGLIAPALIFSYSTASLPGVLVVLVPLAILRYSQKQSIDRTRGYVKELKDKNNDLEKSTGEIEKLYNGLLNTLAEVVDLRDPHVLGHSRQVAAYAVMIARLLNLPPKQVELIQKAGLLHDIGKLGVKESILFKPASLTPTEYSQAKQHVLIGAEILEKSHSMSHLATIIRHHHEHFDGSGYPDGLRGNEIPLEARIIALADAVEAMASDRPYSRSRTQEQILEEIEKNSGSQFDPLLVRFFVDMVKLSQHQVINNSSLLSIDQNNGQPVESPASTPAPAQTA
jgi:diguanylate cyclase (GGDEF)-like protein/putative nucleotidyltransferase with HDIG domain